MAGAPAESASGRHGFVEAGEFVEGPLPAVAFVFDEALQHGERRSCLLPTDIAEERSDAGEVGVSVRKRPISVSGFSPGWMRRKSFRMSLRGRRGSRCWIVPQSLVARGQRASHRESASKALLLWPDRFGRFATALSGAEVASIGSVASRDFPVSMRVRRAWRNVFAGDCVVEDGGAVGGRDSGENCGGRGVANGSQLQCRGVRASGS